MVAIRNYKDLHLQTLRDSSDYTLEEKWKLKTSVYSVVSFYTYIKLILEEYAKYY